VLDQKLLALLKPPPGMVEASELDSNPAFQLVPPRLRERMAWLVYVVLGFASVLILTSLAWQAIRRHDTVAAAESQPT
jgi:cyanate permease